MKQKVRLNHLQGSMKQPYYLQWKTQLNICTGENKELAKTLDKTGGLGTVATRADIIDKLV